MTHAYRLSAQEYYGKPAGHRNYGSGTIGIIGSIGSTGIGSRAATPSIGTRGNDWSNKRAKTVAGHYPAHGQPHRARTHSIDDVQDCFEALPNIFSQAKRRNEEIVANVNRSPEPEEEQQQTFVQAGEGLNHDHHQQLPSSSGGRRFLLSRSQARKGKEGQQEKPGRSSRRGGGAQGLAAPDPSLEFPPPQEQMIPIVPGVGQEEESHQLVEVDQGLAVPIPIPAPTPSAQRTKRNHPQQTPSERLTQSRQSSRRRTPNLDHSTQGELLPKGHWIGGTQEFFPAEPLDTVSTRQPITKQAIQAATKPDFLIALELRLEQELAALDTTNASSATRARTYFGALNTISENLPTYKPILSGLVKYFSDVLREAEGSVLKAADGQFALDALQRKYDTDVSHLKQELSQSDARLKAEIERIDVKIKSRSMAMLVYENEDLNRALDEAKLNISELREKITATARVRHEFERAMRSIEDTFTMMSDEKDLEMNKLRTEAAMEHTDAVATRNHAREELTAMRERLDNMEIAYTVATKHNSLLKNRVRDGETRVHALIQQLETVQAERDAMAERLAAFEGNPELGMHSPTMTPRPSKAEAYSRVDELQDVGEFTSTGGMLAAIYELYAQQKRRLTDAEEVVEELEIAVKVKVAQMMQEERAQLQQQQQQSAANFARSSSNLTATFGEDGMEKSLSRAESTVVISSPPRQKRQVRIQSTFCDDKTYIRGNSQANLKKPPPAESATAAEDKDTEQENPRTEENTGTSTPMS